MMVFVSALANPASTNIRRNLPGRNNTASLSMSQVFTMYWVAGL